MGWKEDQIKKKNEEWGKKNKKKKENDKNHPWYNTNFLIKKKHDKIWTDNITPENKRLEDYK